MYNETYKVELPQFPDREVSITEYGAKSGDLQIETGRHNAEVINRAICEVSEQGGGMVRVPIWGKGVVSPNVRLFPKYDGGEFTLGKTRMLLSRGLGMHTIPVRLFNPGEVLEVDLLPGGEEAGGSDEGK